MRVDMTILKREGRGRDRGWHVLFGLHIGVRIEWNIFRIRHSWISDLSELARFGVDVRGRSTGMEQLLAQFDIEV